jgi:glucuronate isomerase
MSTHTNTTPQSVTSATLELHEDRCFDPDPTVRRFARALYEGTRDLPIVAPHGHVDPRILAEDSPFSEPASLLVTPDHYILRMLYSRGVPLEALGAARRDGRASERDGRRIWQLFAQHIHLFHGTPTGFWLDYELHEVFGVRQRLNRETADQIYDHIFERLRSPEYRPRALFQRFNIEVLATTDAANDALVHHRALRDSGWPGRVIPSFRPDAVFRVARADWRTELARLSAVHGSDIASYDEFLTALRAARARFKQWGARATDHAVVTPLTQWLKPEDAEGIFSRALSGSCTAADQQRFEAHLLMEMAALSIEDGLVMQLHPGALRDHNEQVFERFGPDMGADIPVATEFTYNLRALLNAFGNDPRFTLVLFTLDESTYTRELAPLAGHYPAVRLGPPWWFHDSMEGMKRFRERTTETAGIWNTAGFNDDTRAFCSIPARHDLCRRIDANYLAGLAARHLITLSEAQAMARALAYDLVKETYRL